MFYVQIFRNNRWETLAICYSAREARDSYADFYQICRDNLRVCRVINEPTLETLYTRK